MKQLNEFINEGLFSSKAYFDKRLAKLGIKDSELSKQHSAGHNALWDLLGAIDYIIENPDKFKDYENAAPVLRDAINNILHEGGYTNLLILKNENK